MPVVTGDVKRIAGTTVTSGEVRFTATTPVVQDPSGNVTSLATSVAEHVVPLNGAGAFATTIPATGPDWVYRVEISAFVGGNRVQGLPRLLLEVPATGADLSDAGVEGAQSGRVVVNRLVGNIELSAAIAPIQQTADNALTTAQSAVDTVEAIEGPISARLGALEVLGGLEPGDVSDATVQNLITQEDTDTRTAIDAAIAGYVDTAGVVKSGTVTAVEATGATGVITLKVKPPRTYFDDFQDYELTMFPAGWDQYGTGSARTWTVRASSAAHDNAALFTTGSGPGAISNPLFTDMMDGEVECEMVIKYRMEGSVAAGPRVLLYGSGYPPETTNLYSDGLGAGYVNSTQAAFVETLSGVTSLYQVQTYPSPPVADTWRILLVHRVGEWTYLKDWPHGTTEPSEWLSSFGSSRLWDGWHGIHVPGGGSKRIDWIGFRAGPGTAPRGA